VTGGKILKNAPNSLIWAVVIAFLGVLGSFVALSATGSDTTDLRTFLNTVLNIVAAVFSGGALVVAGAAARSSGQTAEQTNGQLTDRDDTINALRRQVAEHQSVIRSLDPETPYPALQPTGPELGRPRLAHAFVPSTGTGCARLDRDGIPCGYPSILHGGS
jgi:hypothetical protein